MIPPASTTMTATTVVTTTDTTHWPTVLVAILLAGFVLARVCCRARACWRYSPEQAQGLRDIEHGEGEARHTLGDGGPPALSLWARRYLWALASSELHIALAEPCQPLPPAGHEKWALLAEETYATRQLRRGRCTPTHYRAWMSELARLNRPPR